MGSQETDIYPLTGRFLMGRLRHAMTADEKAVVESLIERTETFPKSTTLLRRSQVTDQATLVIEGYMLRAITEGGQRYVVGMHVPGDYADLHGFALKRLDHDILTLGETTVGYTSHARLEQVLHDHPHLARLLWFSTLLDAAIHREWILKLEQLPAARRVAHVFAELWHRLDLVGLGRRDGLRTPLTQTDLADMCGTTPIHMNRSLGQLRKAGVAEFRRGAVYVSDRAALERLAGFNPDYLYGTGPLRMGDELSPR
ncbi:MAG TPA: Crp/Fnr family transcriptional regulator [Croceibacterium sp.]|nr:Crp/Fnr family transcriptional regulator [Croceibacterium sp.]